jgi:metallophosphoesterase (TIGR00282 family)
MSKTIKILFIGDIIGRPGRNTVRKILPELRAKYKPDLVIANAENAASGFGITERVYAELISDLKIDVLTSGNHIWDKKEVMQIIDEMPKLVRPYNYPSNRIPGKGVIIVNVNGTKIAVGNLLGCVFMGTYDSPFYAVDRMLAEIPSEVKIKFVDIHAEATSEKKALGWYLDGRVSAVIGTHTHVQTADNRILPKGTAYITEAGMTGGIDSVIGVDKEKILERFLTQLPIKFDPADGPSTLEGVLLEIDTGTGMALQCARVQEFTEVDKEKH